MVPFAIEVELNNVAVSLWVEQLDRLPDDDGLMRYDVRSGLRQAVVALKMEADPYQPDFTFEAVQAIDGFFSGEELLVIIKAIRDYNDQARFPFNRLPFTN